MTTGQLVFYSGVGLLALTVLLGVFFLVKKPKYIPEQAVYEPGAPQQTQKLRNGYPTDRETRRRTGTPGGGPAPTEPQTAAATELMLDEAAADSGATELL